MSLRFRCFCFFCLFVFSVAAALTQFSLLSLRTALGALRTGNDIYDDASVIFAAFRTCPMSDAESPAFARGNAHAMHRRMGAAFASF